MEKVKPFDRIADYKVHTTNDYRKFKILEGNRSVEKVKKIKDSISKFGYLHKPILVNDNFEVVDGQHRLEACKQLGVPIDYVMQRGLKIAHCQTLNNGQINWGLADYLHLGAVDNADFHMFEILTRKHPLLSPQTILSTYNGTLTGGTYTALVRKGMLTCSDRDFEKADAECCWLDPIVEEIKKAGIKGSAKTNLVIALNFAYGHKNVNVSELARKVHENIGMLRKKPLMTSEDGIIALEDIYNYKCHKGNRINLLSDFREATIASVASSRFSGGEK